MTTRSPGRLFRGLLLAALAGASSCSTFCANYFEPKIYGGVRHIATGVTAMVTSTDLHEKDDSFAMAEDPDVVEMLGRGLMLGTIAIDLPCSAVADTLLLPWQAYLFATHPALSQAPAEKSSTPPDPAPRFTLVRRSYSDKQSAAKCTASEALHIATGYLNVTTTTPARDADEYWHLPGLRYPTGDPHRRGVYVLKRNGNLYRGPTP